MASLLACCTPDSTRVQALSEGMAGAGGACCAGAIFAYGGLRAGIGDGSSMPGRGGASGKGYAVVVGRPQLHDVSVHLVK